jgi:hypothetical protein
MCRQTDVENIIGIFLQPFIVNVQKEVWVYYIVSFIELRLREKKSKHVSTITFHEHYCFLTFQIDLLIQNAMYVLNSFASWVHCGKLVT